jgi:O-antigen ligase
MTISNTWITTLLCAALGLFLVQLPDWSYMAHGAGFCILWGLCLYNLVENRCDLSVNGYTLFAMMFGGLCVVSIGVSDITHSSLAILPTYMILPMVMVFLQGSINTKFLYNILMFLGFVCGLYALYQFYAQSGYYIITTNEPFANPNSLAVFLGVPCLIAWRQILTKQKVKQIALYGLLALLSWAGIVTTSSRGVMLGLFIVIGFVSCLHLSKENKKSVFLKVVFFTSVAFLIFWVLKVSAPNDIFTQSFNVDPESIGSRFNIWRGIIDAIFSNNPLIGNGIGTFKDVYLHYRLPMDRASGLHGHNDILHLILEIGLVVLIPFIILAFTVVKNFSVASGENKSQLLLPLSLLVFITGCAMFTTVILLPSLLLITGIILVDYMKHDGEKTVIQKTYMNKIAIVFLIVLITLQVQKIVETRTMIDLKNASSQSDLNDFRTQINKVDMVSMGSHPAVPIFQTSLLMSLWDTKMIAAPQSDVVNELNGYLDRSKSLNPWNVETLYYRGHILKRKGDIAGAKSAWKNVLKIDPTYVGARIDLANHTTRTEDAYCILKDGLHLKYWKQNPQKLFGQIMVEAQKQSDIKTYEEAERRLTELLR